MSSDAPTLQFALDSHLPKLIAHTNFLQLLSSHEAFPKSKGTGIPIIRLVTDLCEADIALQGAQLLRFRRRHKPPLLWCSPNCDFTPGIALRGGIPLCLPWFGPHPTDPHKPKHGFARNREWQLQTARLQNDGTAELVFSFFNIANELFPVDFSAELSMSLGNKLKLSLKITNASKKTVDLSWALHTYFAVDSLSTIKIPALTGRTYLDNLEKLAAKIQRPDDLFTGEIDRIFLGIEEPLRLIKSSSITISHHNCPSVVVWNPGELSAKKISDIGAGNEKNYLCVERGAVLTEKWQLLEGESRQAWMEIAED